MSSNSKVSASAARSLPSLALWLLVSTAVHAATDPLAIVPPLGFGPYAVGCSDIAQNLSPATGNLSDYWEGVPFDGNAHYVTQILTEPADTVIYPVVMPNDSEL